MPTPVADKTLMDLVNCGTVLRAALRRKLHALGVDADSVTGFRAFSAALDAASEKTVELPQHLEMLILDATKSAGTFDPEQCISFIEEKLTATELAEVCGFLGWVHKRRLTFGWGSIQARYVQYHAERSPAPVAGSLGGGV